MMMMHFTPMHGLASKFKVDSYCTASGNSDEVTVAVFSVPALHCNLCQGAAGWGDELQPCPWTCAEGSCPPCPCCPRFH